ncbi:MAG: hypothetical protein A2075_11685 [Geobacteraceae bacterium GWC2_58_44]|nr:MAG: hypothetical protein A2075_11685 [Geobacteraceae bacterium GWC2_58_44]HBG08295.1 hypothetical protein [Geobacter sp.]
MKCFSYIAVAGGLVCCLSASPARADLATPEAGATEASTGEVLAALQDLTGMMDAASTVSDSSTYASVTKSAGPASDPAISEGMDSSYGSADTGTISTAGFGNTESSDSSGGTGELSQAAAPSGLKGEGAHLVSYNAPVASYDLSTLATSAASPPVVGNEEIANPVVDAIPPAVPIPASVLLLGAGLLGIYPLRRTT